MIVSRAGQLIFVKTRKTAGTSIELSLSRFVDGPEDIVTPVTPADEEHRPSNSPPRNYKRFVNHSSAAQIKRELPDEWERYTTVAFVRNPWDYVVSRYFWERHRTDPHLTMDAVLDEWDPASNWKQITVKGEVAVDRIYRFENLVDGVSDLFRIIGVEFDGWLPRAKGSTGRGGHHYRDVLDQRHVDRIAEACAAEIRAFGYEY